MQDYIEKRVMEISNYISESGSTVRQTAGVFGVSKSTVHKDITERLPQITSLLYVVNLKVRYWIIIRPSGICGEERLPAANTRVCASEMRYK